MAYFNQTSYLQSKPGGLRHYFCQMNPLCRFLTLPPPPSQQSNVDASKGKPTVYRDCGGGGGGVGVFCNKNTTEIGHALRQNLQ